MTASKPVKNHKLGSVSYGVRVSCECGWSSSTWYCKGARTQAFAEFNGHKERHRPISERIADASRISTLVKELTR